MFYVLSFDPKKIEVASAPGGETIVRKKTTEKEHRNITLARQHLLKHCPILTSNEWGMISISVAEIFGWDQKLKTLSTIFYQGKNLEEVLRESIGQERAKLIDLMRKTFEVFKSSGFLWGDFAPRNMIWDQSRKTIWLVDFERELHLKDCSIEQYTFNRYVRSYSREEFSCFLSRQEQSMLFNGFLEENYSGFIPISQIDSKRKKTFLKSMFSDKKCYSLNEVRQIEDIMASVATPFMINDTFFFPMDSLDQIGSKGGPNEYVSTVTAIHRLEGYERFSELKRRTKAL